MKTLKNYVLESSNNYFSALNDILLVDENLSMDECLESFNEDNIDKAAQDMINEGFWDFMKSIFSSSGRKKYKEAYDSWVKDNTEAKKRQEQQDKLNKEFDDKKKMLADKLKAAKSEDEIQKVAKELTELFNKKTDVEEKIDNESKDTVDNASTEVKNEMAINGIEDLILNIKERLTIYKKAADDVKKNIIEGVKKRINRYVEKYNAVSEDVKKTIQDGIKKAKMDKYLEATGNEIKFNEQEFANDGSQESEESKPEDVKQEIEEKTADAVKDNADMLKSIIEVTGISNISSDKLMKAVNNILQTAAKDVNDDKNIKITKTTSLGVAVMLLGATMVRMDSNAASSYNRGALKIIGEYFAKNYDKFSVKVLK